MALSGNSYSIWESRSGEDRIYLLSQIKGYLNKIGKKEIHSGCVSEPSQKKMKISPG